MVVVEFSDENYGMVMGLIQCIHDKAVALKAILKGDEYLNSSKEEEEEEKEETVSVQVKGRYM